MSGSPGSQSLRLFIYLPIPCSISKISVLSMPQLVQKPSWRAILRPKFIRVTNAVIAARRVSFVILGDLGRSLAAHADLVAHFFLPCLFLFFLILILYPFLGEIKRFWKKTFKNFGTNLKLPKDIENSQLVITSRELSVSPGDASAGFSASPKAGPTLQRQ